MDTFSKDGQKILSLQMQIEGEQRRLNAILANARKGVYGNYTDQKDPTTDLILPLVLMQNSLNRAMETLKSFNV
jgi:hypothetical protein